MALKFYASLAKGLKLKVRKCFGLTPTFVEVTWEKLVNGIFLHHPPPPHPTPFLLNRVESYFQSAAKFMLYQVDIYLNNVPQQ